MSQSPNIEPEERKSVLLLFLYGFGNAASYVLARTVADSTFLSLFGADRLPELYMLSAGVVALVSIVYLNRVRHHGLRRTVMATLVLFSFCSILLPWLMSASGGALPVFVFAYLLAQIRGSLGTIQYATVLNEQFGDRHPERVVGVVGAGATLAGISMGLMVGMLADDFAVEWLLYVAAAIDLLTILPLLALRAGRRRLVESMEQANEAEPHVWSRESKRVLYAPSDGDPARLRDLLRSRYVLYIAATVTVCILATTLVEYQWKVVASDTFDRDALELARYFGLFYGLLYLVTGVLQLFLTSRLLRRKGILFGLMAFPAALLTTSLAAWLAPGEFFLFAILTICKGTDVLRRALFDPTLQVLYGPMEKGLRRHAIGFVAGIAKPFAEAVAGILMVLFVRAFLPQQLSIVVVILVCIWLVVSVPVWRNYLARLY